MTEKREELSLPLSAWLVFTPAWRIEPNTLLVCWSTWRIFTATCSPTWSVVVDPQRRRVLLARRQLTVRGALPLDPPGGRKRERRSL